MIRQPTLVAERDSKFVGLQWGPFLAKAFLQIVMASFSVVVMVLGYPLMDYDKNYTLKVCGVIFSEGLLVFAFYEAIITAVVLLAERSTRKEMEDDAMDDKTDFCVNILIGIIFLVISPLFIPCLIVALIFAQNKRWYGASILIGLIDILQTALLFPLAVVVIFVSETPIDVFVNVVALQIFGNLDDTIAYALSYKFRKEIVRKLMDLYFKWSDTSGKGFDEAQIEQLRALVIEIQEESANGEAELVSVDQLEE